jgi:hypothetical protein
VTGRAQIVGELVTRTLLAVLGAITTLPALALVLPGTSLDLSYGISAPADPMVLALLQHRGALQAALGAALIWAAFQPVARTPVALTAIATKSRRSFICVFDISKMG